MSTSTAKVAITTLKGDVEELRRMLPLIDLDTGLKNRLIKRDPITGLGELPKEHCDFSRPKSTKVLKKNEFSIISWDIDKKNPENQNVNELMKNKIGRNPIALTGDLGDEVDALKRNSRPRTNTPREPQRNPISGQGNFGYREWDPIWKYNGKARRAHSSHGEERNPLTGKNAKTFTISTEEKNHRMMSPKPFRAVRNVITGDNCENYVVSTDFKSNGPKRRHESDRNAITGANCTTYDVNIENTRNEKSKAKRLLPKTNPLNGENVLNFTVMKEEKPRNIKPYVYSNTVTGENCQSYKINPIERNIASKPNKTPSNPLIGENIQHYTYRIGEKEKIVKKRDISSPLTGGGSRGNTYSISVEERKRCASPSAPKFAQNGCNGTQKSPYISRNVLTGENCKTYMVCQEMRSERGSLNKLEITRNGHKDGYNILTGGLE